MLSNNCLSAVVDSIDHLDLARKAQSKADAVFYLGLAESALRRVLATMPPHHSYRLAVEAKRRQVIMVRGAMI